MVVSPRFTRVKTDKYHRNVLRRGNVPESTSRPKSPFSVGPLMLGFFLFVVVGSSLLQIIKTATSGLPGMPPPPR